MNEVRILRIHSDQVLKPTWIYTLDAGSESDAETIIENHFNDLGNSFEGRQITGLSYRLLHIEPRPAFQWIIDLILGTRARRIFSYEVSIHLARLRRPSQADRPAI